jgi:hypothetical protein
LIISLIFHFHADWYWFHCWLPIFTPLRRLYFSISFSLAFHSVYYHFITPSYFRLFALFSLIFRFRYFHSDMIIFHWIFILSFRFRRFRFQMADIISPFCHWLHIFSFH